MNIKMKTIVILCISIIGVLMLSSIVYKNIYDKEYTIRKYFVSLNAKEYNEVFDILYSKREPYNEKQKFIDQMNTIDKNEELYKNSYLEFLRGSEIKEIKICPIGYSKPEEEEYLNDASLLELGSWISHEHFDKKVSVFEYLGQFGVKITVKDEQGQKKTFNTVVALKKSEGMVEKFFTKYKVVDPCLLRTIWIYPEHGTEIYIDNIKAFKIEDLDTYVAYEVLPGRHSIKLSNPQIGDAEKEIFVTASFMETGKYYFIN